MGVFIVVFSSKGFVPVYSMDLLEPARVQQVQIGTVILPTLSPS